ncbi:MAG: nitrite reductase [Bacillales bacterium]|jgi:nitrite reductase (cytochrome c-552)|nr:nitrite reductase [Bacillales bacterium]
MRNLKLLLIALVLIIITFSLSACNDKEQDAKNLTTGLKATEINNEAFKKLFPLQYKSYMSNMEMEDTTYGGSEPRSKFSDDKEPLLPILFNGYPFATDYNEDRGHTYAMVDIERTLRVTDKTAGGCLSCKSTVVPQLIADMGEHYWKAGSFKSEVLPKAKAAGHSAVGCSDCHNPVNMDLRVTRPMFIDAMKEKGIDVAHATKNEMRTYVCAQCHSEYFFKAETNVVTFPWKDGLSAEAMYGYYDKERANPTSFQKDYISNISGAPILKAQHPDYENYTQGTHAKAGVSCADCHMQYERMDNGKKISSHQWTSPLKSMDTSCGTCHSSRDMKDLEKQVQGIQKTYKEALDHAEEISMNAHYYVNKMITSGVDTAKVKEAQEQIRLGQWLWDYNAAENSTGFHNPQGAMDTLMKSANASNKAIQIATEELVKKGVNISELKAEIEKAKNAVITEKDTTKKKNSAVNAYFPGQQPVVPATPAK